MVQKQSKSNIYSNYTDSDNFAHEQSTNVCENLAHLTQSIKMQKQGYTLRSINKIHPRVIKNAHLTHKTLSLQNTRSAIYTFLTFSGQLAAHQLTNWLRLPLAKSVAPPAHVLAQKQPHSATAYVPVAGGHSGKLTTTLWQRRLDRPPAYLMRRLQSVLKAAARLKTLLFTESYPDIRLIWHFVCTVHTVYSGPSCVLNT